MSQTLPDKQTWAKFVARSVRKRLELFLLILDQNIVSQMLNKQCLTAWPGLELTIPARYMTKEGIHSRKNLICQPLKTLKPNKASKTLACMQSWHLPNDEKLLEKHPNIAYQARRLNVLKRHKHCSCNVLFLVCLQQKGVVFELLKIEILLQSKFCCNCFGSKCFAKKHCFESEFKCLANKTMFWSFGQKLEDEDRN